ncbi:hypothetical protein [Streptomyces sp. NPDC055681]
MASTGAICGRLTMTMTLPALSQDALRFLPCRTPAPRLGRLPELLALRPCLDQPFQRVAALVRESGDVVHGHGVSELDGTFDLGVVPWSALIS